MPARLRSHLVAWIFLVYALAPVAVFGTARIPSGPPLTHPLLPTGLEPASLTAHPPTRDELRASLAGANLVICVLDAARADHIGCYGYPRETTPNIDRLAAQSFVFEQHFCQYPQTRPSTASLFTGQYPDTHLIWDLRRMQPTSFTLARGLDQGGFHTALLSSMRWVSSAMGLGRDFELTGSRHRGRSRRPGPMAGRPQIGQGGHGARSPEALLQRVSDWLDGKPPSPFFAYIHFLPPHLPYNPPEEMKRLFAGKKPPGFQQGPFPFPEVIETAWPDEHSPPGTKSVNVYDANLRYADWAVGELEKLLRQAGTFDNTLLIITADHGEAFGEHGYRWHPYCPYDEVIRIPLIMKFPGNKPPAGRVRALTQTIDILPTIFDLFQLAYPRNSVQGRSLLPLLTGEVEELNDYIFCRTAGHPPAYVVHGLRFALLLYQGGKLRALYDIETDPWQTRNVIEEQPERAAELIEAFREFAMAQRHPPLGFLDPNAKIEALPSVPEVELSDEARRELEAIGYLE